MSIGRLRVGAIVKPHGLITQSPPLGFSQLVAAGTKFRRLHRSRRLLFASYLPYPTVQADCQFFGKDLKKKD
jgi:hypothetical protein